MSHNNTQLVIVDGPNLYVHAGHQRLAPITSGLARLEDVGFIDGYSIFVAPDTDQFYLSAIDDARHEDPLDFSSADAQPDNVVTSLVLHRELLLLGLYTTEIWINSGGAAVPVRTLQLGADRRRLRRQKPHRRLRLGVLDRPDAHRKRHRLPDGRARAAAGVHARDRADAGKSTDLAGVDVDLPGGRPRVHRHQRAGLSTTLVYDAAMQQWHERAEWGAAGRRFASRRCAT
jgi:hypothetical protein